MTVISEGTVDLCSDRQLAGDLVKSRQATSLVSEWQPVREKGWLGWAW